MNITTVSTSLLGVAAAAMLAACAPNLVVPTPLAGTVKVKIVNDTDDSLCTITLTPDSKNIVGGAFFSHRDGMIALKPGLYQIHASSVGCGGGLSGDGRVEVREATELHIGGTARAASPGFAFASIGMGFDQSAQRGVGATRQPRSRKRMEDGVHWEFRRCVIAWFKPQRSERGTGIVQLQLQLQLTQLAVIEQARSVRPGLQAAGRRRPEQPRVLQHEDGLADPQLHVLRERQRLQLS